MNKKAVLICKRHSKESGFPFRKYRKEYLALSWDKRHEYKQRLMEELSDRTKMHFKFKRGLGNKEMGVANQ